MSTVVDEIEQTPAQEDPVTPQYQTEDGKPNVALLEDRTPASLRASSSVTIITAALGVLFVLLNYFPLWHTDLWGHLSYGRWIWSQGHLPATEPLLPLAQGVTFVDTAWLSQLIGYLTYQQFGTAGMQMLYAVAITAVAAILAFSLYARTQQPWIALLSVFFFYWCDYQQLIIVRPQLAGMVCFAAVFAMATAHRWRASYIWLIPAVFAFWANLHGSFVIGLALLGALTVGRGLDVFRRTMSLKMVLAERRTRQLLYATELAAIAVLLNPYGIGIYPEVLAIAGHPNMESLIEWDPLTLRMKQGQAAAALAIALIGVYRLSPRRVTTGEVLLLLGLGLGAMWTSRIIVWWAPVAAYYFGLHAAAVWRIWMQSRPKEPKRGGVYSVSVLGLLWILFAITPLGGQVLRERETTLEQSQEKYERAVSRSTPLEAATYLHEHPPQGLVFNSYEWGDYLLWSQPDDLQLFVASHVHLIPEEIWNDYREISQAGPNWSSRLDRYGVNTVVIDAVKHKGLGLRLDDDTETWEKGFESNRTMIFHRRKPI